MPLVTSAALPAPYRDVPPLLGGDDPFTRDDDGFDAARVDYVRRLWHSQDEALRDRDRLIEKHLRFLAGQQWMVWSQMLGRWVDVSRYMNDEERRWRFLPVINRLLHWFMLLHARTTENPPILSFQAAGADRLDAELAEVMDVVWKHLWREASMPSALSDMFAWLIPGGQAHIKSRIDPMRGEPMEYIGPAVLQLMGPDGELVLGRDGAPIERYARAVPYGPDGQPRARLLEDGSYEATGEPHREFEGGIVADAISPLEVRGQWGPTPWHRKSFHIQRSLFTPEEVFEAFGVEVEPDLVGGAAGDAGETRRILRGSGFFGAATGREVFSGETGPTQELVEVFELWQAPSRFPGTERGRGMPGGRLLVVAGNKRIRDGQRYAAFEWTSPIRTFRFVNVPGRPSGTSPMEMLIGPQTTYNRVTAQILQHSTLASNPVTIVDETVIPQGTMTNRPGGIVYAKLGGQYAGDPVHFIAPASLSPDVWRTTEHLRDAMDEIGNIAGAQGNPPTADASGELVKELRSNSDRFIGPTLAGAVEELARMADDWRVMIPLIWDRRKILRVAGDDQVATTVVVYPELFAHGHVNVFPDVESMLPESRAERQQRVAWMYSQGLYGPPGTPEAIDQFHERARFPHQGRTSRPGGIDRVTASQNVGKLALGVDPRAIPIFPWYDHAVHLWVLERFMKSPEYLKVDPRIQQNFVDYRTMLLLAQAQKATEDMQLQAGLERQKRATLLAAGLVDPAQGAGPAPGGEAPPNGTPRIAPGPPESGPSARIPA